MASAPSPTQISDRQRIFLFSHVRTRSNLFMKVLGENPQITKIMYPFFVAYKWGPEPTFQRQAPIHFPALPVDSREETYQKAYDRMMIKIHEAEEQGTIPFMMNHTYFIYRPDVIANNLVDLYNTERREALPIPSIVDQSQQIGVKDANGRFPMVDHTNPTLLPDSFLHTITDPIFLFRHPARFVPSFYRAASSTPEEAAFDVSHDGPEFPISATMRWIRLLYDWFADNRDDSKAGATHSEDLSANSTPKASTTAPQPRSYPSRRPILIDADDVLHDPTLMPRLCAELGLDPTQLKYSWEPLLPEARKAGGPILEIMQSSLHRSSGIETTRDTELDINMEAERANLIQEFGREVGEGLFSLVEASVADWQYLRARKF